MIKAGIKGGMIKAGVGAEVGGEMKNHVTPSSRKSGYYCMRSLSGSVVGMLQSADKPSSLLVKPAKTRFIHNHCAILK